MSIGTPLRSRLVAAPMLVLGVWCLMRTSTAAWVGTPLTFEEIVRSADLIVRGQVTDVRAITDPETGVESVVTVAVDAALKGSTDGFVSFRVPGGTIGRARTTMVGAPVLYPRETAVFFLKRDPSGAWRPVGLAAGIVTIGRDAATGAAVVHAPVRRTRTADGEPVVRGDASRVLLRVSDFESLVRLAMAASTARTARGRE
jgi:hypothetical protein